MEASTASGVTQLPSTLFKNGSASDHIEGVWAGVDPNDGGLQTWIIDRKGKAYQVRAQERQHFSRKLKWGPSDFSGEKLAGD